MNQGDMDLEDVPASFGRRLDFLIPSYLENPDAFAQTEDMDFSSILTIAASNLAFGVCCICIYEFFRRRGSYFIPKARWRPHMTPPPLPTGKFLGWVVPLLSIDEETVLRCAGVDGVIYLRFMSLGIQVFGMFILVGFGLLLPVNLSCSKWEDGEDSSKYYDLNLFMQCTLSNVPARDKRLWFHLGASYVLTFVTMHFLSKECRAYTKLRHRFLASNAVHLRTILVERIPRELRSNSRLTAYFSRMYPNQVLAVNLTQDLSPLEKLVVTREKVLTKLERFITLRHRSGKEQYHQAQCLMCPTIDGDVNVTPQSSHSSEVDSGCCSGACCSQGKINSIDHYTKILRKLNETIIAQQELRQRTLTERDHEHESEEARLYVDSFFHRTQTWGSTMPLSIPPAVAVSTMAKDDSVAGDYNEYMSIHCEEGTTTAGTGEDRFRLAYEDESMTSSVPTAVVDHVDISYQSGNSMGGARPGGGASRKDNRYASVVAQQQIDGQTFVDCQDQYNMAASDSDLDDDLTDDEAELSDMEWGRNMCSRIVLVLQYATSTTSMLRDLNRVLCVAKVKPEPTTHNEYSNLLDGRGGPRELGGERAGGTNHNHHHHSTHASSSSNKGGVGAAFLDKSAMALPAALSEEGRVMSKAFVTFKSLVPATIAQQVLHYAKPGGLTITSAPEPRDVFWTNMYMAKQESLYRKLVMDCCVALALISYIVPVTLINFVASPTALQEYVPLIKKMCDASPLFVTMIDMVQPMCLMGLMALLPPVILGMSYWEGMPSMSSAQHRQVSRYFTFQVLHVFLVSTVAGSVLKALGRVVDEPELTFKMLADSLPKVSGFFCCYLLMKGLSGMSMEIARIVPVFQHVMKMILLPGITARDRKAECLGTRDFFNPGWFPYGKYCAQDMLIVVVTMTYACIAPMILIPALIFFSMGLLVYKHQLLYVYYPIFESGGLFWPKIYRRWIFALFISQATMLGMFILKYGYAQAYCQIALMIITFIFKMKMKSTYTTSDSVAAHLPLELAASLDQARFGPRDGDCFIQPALRAKGNEEPHTMSEPVLAKQHWRSK